MASRDCIGKDACSVVGNTPMVYLNRVTDGCKAKIAVKLEYLNPACSVKDRIGYAMIKAAEDAGKIRPGVTTLIEPTSGNMGVGLAFVAAARGYKFIAIMPSWVSMERRSVVRAYGAEVVVTDPAKGMKGSVERAHELAKRIPNSHILQQFENPENPRVHYMTTGPEIWKQTAGELGAAVFGIGSGGTLAGAGKFLKEQNKDIRLYAVEPEESAVLSGSSPGPHQIPGMGIGYVPQVLDTSLYDGVIAVHSDEAIAMARRLAVEEGLLCGISSGANVVAAIRVGNMPGMEGKLVVTMLPSFGERYLSSPLYANVRDETTALGHNETLEENLKRIAHSS